jgi:hypothetical protein
MTRAFIVLGRNDLSPNGLQVLDLFPNSSRRNLIYDPAGQTGYLSFFRQNDLPTVTGAGPITASSTVYGLRAYLLSNIDNQAAGGGNHNTPSVANCTTIANAILSAVNAGTALTAAVVDGLVAATCANSDLTGGTAASSQSTGSIVGLLRVLSGEVYRLSSGAVVAAGVGATFVGNVGAFVTAPDLTPSTGLGGGMNGGADPAYGFPVVRYQAPAQSGTRDLTFRNVRRFDVNTYLTLSASVGALSKLDSATFSWFNPGFTYVASTGTALSVTGANLTSYVQRGVTVYSETGTPL